MSPIALLDDASAEAPAERVPAESGVGRIAVVGAAVVVGLPAMIEVVRFVTTIVLSLILGH